MIKIDFKYKLVYFLLLISIMFSLNSCQDAAPTEYTPSYVVEALLLVNEPIRDIIVLQSASLRDSFKLENTFLTDARVQIIGDSNIFELTPDFEKKTYFLHDTTYKIKPQTKYDLKVTLSDGTMISGTTFTPNQFNWIQEPPYLIQYPKDTLNLPSTFKVSWTKTDTIKYYILSIKALDTLEYGKYIEPPTEEKNRRILRKWNENSKNYFKDITSWSFAPATELPVVWNFFKWFGPQELSVYAPDDNFLLWSLQVFSFRELNPQLSSVKGAFGYFGSASVIRSQGLLLKNQP